MAGSNGGDLPRQGVQDIVNLTLDGKREAATTALQSLGSSGADVKKEVATTAVQTLGATAVDAKKEIATTVLQTLSPEQRQEVIGQIQGPTRKISDRIQQWLVGVLLVALILSIVALVAGSLLDSPQVEALTSVVAVTTGIIAGYLAINREGGQD
jgi:predicted lysophospholipase L1 biosynthesis ABC-type transport system permease subunit